MGVLAEEEKNLEQTGPGIEWGEWGDKSDPG
jgi:hypothetical protein